MPVLSLWGGGRNNALYSYAWVLRDGRALAEINYDYGVSFRPQQSKKADYNYRTIDLDDDDTDLPVISVFYKDDDGTIYHTYSSYGRGIDLMNATYNYMDLTPKGREDFGRPMWWLRRRDEY